MKSSMSRKGNRWDNAVAESFFASASKARMALKKMSIFS